MGNGHEKREVFENIYQILYILTGLRCKHIVKSYHGINGARKWYFFISERIMKETSLHGELILVI